jgi:hypothetical protein
MAYPVVASASKLLLKLGDGASPEVFAAPCGITTKAFNFASAVSEIDLVDCDDPDAVGWVGNEKRNSSLSVTANGVLDTTVLDTYWDFYRSVDARNVQMQLNVASGVGGGHWEGAMHLIGFNVTGTHGEKVLVDLSMVSDGEVQWVDAT